MNYFPHFGSCAVEMEEEVPMWRKCTLTYSGGMGHWVSNCLNYSYYSQIAHEGGDRSFVLFL